MTYKDILHTPLNKFTIKRWFFLITIATFFFISNVFAQNYNWITPNKIYLKMYVADEGIYRINKTDFINAGINTTGLDPRTVKVHYLGAQIPIYFEGEQDGVFDAIDYFDFYGTRNNGGLTKTYTEDNQIAYTTNEYYNLYSDTNVYWIGWGGANGLRMQISNYSAPILYSPQYSLEMIHLEKDKLYTLGEIMSATDFRNFTNEKFLGEGLYWTILNNINNANNLSVSDTFSLPLLYTSPQNATIRIFAYPRSISSTIFNEHGLEIRINGNLISTIICNDFKKIDTTLTFSSSLLTNSGVNTVMATYAPAPGFATEGSMYFDLFELQYPKMFKFRNNQASLITNGIDTTSRKFNLSGYVAGNPISIYDVTNGIKINSYTNSSDTLKFSGKVKSKFEIINKNITKKPLRIIQRQVPNYASTSSGADYIIVYNTIFESQAAQLKSYRETKNNFRVTKAEIQDIYDIFNYGIEGPAGLKNFIKYVYNNWQSPKLKYICLFGRGSLDPKKIFSASVYYKNLIPAYGSPSTDNYFSNINPAGFTYYNQIAIGRLPAYTATEAQSMVDNIVTYESQVAQDWGKTFTFIAGGVDINEQTLFLSLNNDSLINPLVIPPPVSGNPVRILRNDLNGGITYNYSDSIKNQINRGTLTVNFMGHAGSQDWEIGMTNPNVLSNFNGKFPFIMSMTCYTGKIAEPNFRVFGERFMTMNNKGAIGYLGSAGWGFVYSGNRLNVLMMEAIVKDTLRRIGDIFAYATQRMKSDSISFSPRHTINCYTLQGDPAVEINLPKIPEYVLKDSDYKISNSSPSVNEPITLTVYPKNYGLHSDSCKIRFRLNKNLRHYLTIDTTLKNFKYSDSVKFNFILDINDTYNANVILDYPNLNPNENKNNNILSVNISTKNIAFLPLMPINNSVIKTDSVVLVGLNPHVNKNKNTITLLLELDTTINFNSSLKKVFIKTKVAGASTKFKTVLPRLDSNILYYWRTNSVVNADSAGWSQYQIFRYNPLVSTPDETYSLLQDTLSTIYKNKSIQYSYIDFNNTNFSTSGIKLNEFTGNLYVRSFGSNGSEASYFSVINNSIHIDAGANTGLNLLKVRKLDGSILQFKNFKMTFPNSSDSVLNFLNTFDSTQYLMGLNAAWVQGTFLLNASTINKFAQFGSTKVQNIRIGWFDTWSFIGYLNAPQSDVSEAMNDFQGVWIESVSSVDRTFKKSSGTVSYIIGPANNWKDFSWQNTLLPSNNIKFDVYGIDKDGLQRVLFSNLITNNLVSLSIINAYQYPKLNIIAKLNIDTLNGNLSPVLNSFKIRYTPPSEAAPDLSSFWQSDTSLKIGKELKIKFKYYNAGNVKLRGVIVNIYKLSISPLNIIKSDTIYSELKVDSSANYLGKFFIPYIRLTETNKAKFIVEVLPKAPVNEFYTHNNAIEFNLSLVNNSSISMVDVYSDGQLIKSGDYVRQNPEIKINFKNLNTNISMLSDTLRAALILNDSYVPYFVNGRINSLLKISEQENADFGSNPEKMLYYYPLLNAGENKLKIISNNELDYIDTIEYSILVSDELLIKDFYNYPNPMKEETSFILNLLGSEIPFSSKIKIYTVSGRLVKEIKLSANIGYNQIPWDGRDNDGDEIANGIYLYKFITEDNSKKETAIQKLVVLK